MEQLKYILTKENIKIVNIDYKENVELTLEIPEEKWNLISDENERLGLEITIKENTTKKYIEI